MLQRLLSITSSSLDACRDNFEDKLPKVLAHLYTHGFPRLKNNHYVIMLTT